MKPPGICKTGIAVNVAPRAGAWIETAVILYVALEVKVAPRAGAWIETTACNSVIYFATRRTPCGCVD